MFQRRVPKKLEVLVRDMIWPKMGWVRALQYRMHRIFRCGDSAYKITAGLATGAAVSFSPFLGTHIIQSIIVAKVIKANWGAAVAGTVWGNPWTFPLLFTTSYMSGAWTLRITGADAGVAMLPANINLDYFLEKPAEFFLYLLGHPFELLVPMTVGSLLSGVVFWMFAYCVLYYPVVCTIKAYAGKRALMRQRLAKMREKIKK